MAGADLEERLVELFMQRLEALNGAARQAIAAALNEPDGEVAIYSAHELPPATRRRLTTAVQPFRPRDAGNGIRFATDPGLIAGLELRAGGYKVAWSLADYLDGLEEALAGVLRP
jgi:F-type H+-transporting ATPase subunit b